MRDGSLQLFPYLLDRSLDDPRGYNKEVLEVLYGD